MISHRLQKLCIKLCPYSAMILGKTNYCLVLLQSSQIMPELNYLNIQLSFNQRDLPRLLFGNNLLSKKVFNLSSTVCLVITVV